MYDHLYVSLKNQRVKEEDRHEGHILLQFMVLKLEYKYFIIEDILMESQLLLPLSTHITHDNWTE